MKILVIKLSPVEGLNSSMIRTLALVKGLRSLGHSIDLVVTPISNTHVKTNHSDITREVNIIQTSKNSVYDKVVTNKNKSLIKRLVTHLSRKIYHKISLYNYTYYIAKKIDISILNRNKYDILISVSDPKTSHIAMENLINQGLKYKKWIQYWGDPMTLDITNKSMHPNFVIRSAERKILRETDKIVYVSPFTLKEQQLLFPEFAKKMCFIPPPYVEKKEYSNTKNKIYTIGYYGAYKSNVRNIMPLYKSGTNLVGKVHLDIIGDTDISLQGTKNINILPRGDITEYEENADLLICILNNKGTQIPGKLYHYAATNKPILVILDGDRQSEIKEYLESFDRYIICENNILSITNKIEEIMAKDFNNKPYEHFDPKVVATKFISEL